MLPSALSTASASATLVPFAAQLPTPHHCCVRFAVVVTFHHATLTTRQPLSLTWTGLAPTGTRQLPWRTDSVLMQVEVKSVPHLRRSDNVGESMPQPRPGWANVWQSALRASKPKPLPRKTFPGRACRAADPSASLGMTKGRVSPPCTSGGWWKELQVPPLPSPGFPSTGNLMEPRDLSFFSALSSRLKDSVNPLAVAFPVPSSWFLPLPGHPGCA
jgi:hypothetical protein